MDPFYYNFKHIKADDLLSTLRYFNRRQLLQFLHVNRCGRHIVEKHFADAPYIYAALSFYRKRTDPTELELKLTGLICNCEQQLCCDQQLFIYKKLLAHPPFENLDLDSHLGAERAKQFRRFECNYPGHELCPDWEEVDYKDVDPVSDTSLHSGCQPDHCLCGLGKESCYRFWRHKVHDDELVKQEIIGKNLIRHRTFDYACGRVMLLTTDVSLIFEHLQPTYVRVKRLEIMEDAGYQCEVQPDGSIGSFSETDCQKILRVLHWFVENHKLGADTFVSVDFALLNECIFERCQLDLAERHFLLTALGNCAHLRLIQNVAYSGGEELRANLISKAAIIELSVEECENYSFISQFISKYNPQKDHHRLAIFSLDSLPNAARSFVMDFVAAEIESTFFLLLNGVILKFDELPLIHHNRHTNECLRIMPTCRYSLHAKDAVSVFLARYSVSNETAVREFEALNARVQNGIKDICKRLADEQFTMGFNKFTEVNHKDLLQLFSVLEMRYLTRRLRKEIVDDCFTGSDFLTRLFPGSAERFLVAAKFNTSMLCDFGSYNELKKIEWNLMI